MMGRNSLILRWKIELWTPKCRMGILVLGREDLQDRSGGNSKKNWVLSSEDANFKAKAKDVDDETQCPQERKVVEDLGIFGDEEIKSYDKTEVGEQYFSPFIIQRHLKDFKRDYFLLNYTSRKLTLIITGMKNFSFRYMLQCKCLDQSTMATC